MRLQLIVKKLLAASSYDDELSGCSKLTNLLGGGGSITSAHT